MHLPPSVQSVCWFVFDPEWAAVNYLNSVRSSTSLCGTPVVTPNLLREVMTSQWFNLSTLLSLALLSTDLFAPSMTLQWPAAVRQRCARVTIAADEMCKVSAQGADDMILYRYWRITKSSCWVHYCISSELRACQILMEQSKEKAKIGSIILLYRQHQFIVADIIVITNREE